MKKNDRDRRVPLLTKTIRIMKVTSLCNLLAVCPISASTYAQSLKFSIHKQNSSISEVFKEIEKKSDFTFFFNDNQINVKQKVNVSANNASIEDVLAQVLQNTGYNYQIIDKQILIKVSDKEVMAVPAIAQSGKKITGTVLDATGMPVIGANVMVKGTTNGTITDMDGKFSLDVQKGKTLLITYIGYADQEIKIEDSSKNLSITLKEDYQALDEVVAVGYTSMKRKDIAGSVVSISNEKINRIPANDITTALVGVPGVRMDGGAIRIRGTRSRNASNDPLIVLDGVPYNETLASINPGDIETIDILKDAASTAIYGARGANGVILITTRQAKQGKTQVSYDGFVGFGKNNWGSLDVMNAEEYTMFKREAYRAAGTWHSEADDSKAFFGTEMNNIGKVNTDWFGEYFNRKRFWTNHMVTVSSANEKTQYKISINYKNDDQREKGAGSDKFYLTTDLSHKVLPFLKVGLSNRMYYINTKNKPSQFGSLMQMTPLTPIYNDDGTLNENPFGDPFIRNPFLNDNDAFYKNKTEEWKIFLRFFANVDLAKNLTYTTNFSYNPAFSSGGYYYDKRSAATNDDRNIAYNHNNRAASWVWNNVLNYKLELGKHTLNLTGVYEMQNNESVSASMSGRDQESPIYLWYNMGRLTDSKSLSSGFSRTQMISYIARAQYDYAGKYIVSASVREDGASQLSVGHKWATFPSGAVAWRLSEEEFLKSLEWISNLKLKASYGLTGNYAIAAYATTGSLYGVYSTFKSATGEVHYPGLEPSTRPTPDLEWEKNKMLNIGLEYGFLDGRIFGEISWYDSKSFDLLYLKTLPYTTGFNQAWTNIGDTRNRGIEASLTLIPIQKKDLDLNVTLSYYRNKEELVQLQDPNMKEDINNGLFVGYPVNGVYYTYKQVGIWQENEADLAAIYGQKPGEVKVADLDGNQKIDGNDRMIIGTNRPDWIGSLSLSGHWKNLDFSADVYGEFGALGYDSYSTDTWGSTTGRWNTVNVDYYTPEHPSNRHPRPVFGQTIKYLGATGYYKNNYVNIRNLTLGYTLPSSWLEHNKVVKKCRFYVTANDPIRYSRMQHDGGMTYWESFYIMGVNLQF